ncbi:MAG: hypothetical protein QW651_06735 [Candidatus Nezhaarchaeales archaeon]
MKALKEAVKGGGLRAPLKTTQLKAFSNCFASGSSFQAARVEAPYL